MKVEKKQPLRVAKTGITRRYQDISRSINYEQKKPRIDPMLLGSLVKGETTKKKP